jgi:feruloyl esterase
MVPGMNHCRGGDGTDTFDAVAALDQWVVRAKAPDQILASHSTRGVVDKTRPLCPYPEVAKYKGTGNTKDAVNFVCKAP